MPRNKTRDVYLFIKYRINMVISKSSERNKTEISDFSQKKKSENPIFKIRPYIAVCPKGKLKGFFEAKKDMSVISSYLEGNFDNQNQFSTLHDISQQFIDFPKLEHIHCIIKNFGESCEGKQFFTATYYFPKIGFNFFRTRFYALYPNILSYCCKSIISMDIYKINPLETKNLVSEKQNNICKNIDINLSAIKFNYGTVFWEKGFDYKYTENIRSIFKGHLSRGGCSIYSNVLICFLHINDDLIITNTELFVNDRGFNEELSLIYGNINEIFFQLERIKKGMWFDWLFL